MSKVSTKGQWNAGFSTILAKNVSLGHHVARKMTIVVPAYQTVVTNLPWSSEHGCQQDKENKKWTDRHPVTRKKRSQIVYYNYTKLYLLKISTFVVEKWPECCGLTSINTVTLYTVVLIQTWITEGQWDYENLKCKCGVLPSAYSSKVIYLFFKSRWLMLNVCFFNYYYYFSAF
jgi:hypothetical protein